MKKIFITLTIFSSAIAVFGQSQDHRWSVGLNGGLSDFIGEASGHQSFNFRGAIRGQVGANVFYNLNNWFSLGADFTTGKMGHHASFGQTLEGLSSFRATSNHGHLALRLKFNNGRILSETSRIQPYLMAGIGLVNFSAHSSNDVEGVHYQGLTTHTFNTGLGLTYMLTERFGLNYNLNYAVTGSDNIDMRERGRNDQYIIHTIGVNYSFRAKKSKDITEKIVEETKPVVAAVVDSDGDGVPDHLDKCPNTPKGVKVDKDGCPVIEDKIIAEIQTIAKSIFFETNSDKISDTCFAKLDRLVDLLNSPDVPKETILDIEGHTDNTGNFDFNLSLSQKRADAVKAYLVSKGVSAERLQSEGFGPKKPKADNSTREGRIQNRRVELILHY
ncbi:MAG: OmpA family protein [Cryomorphaceae bacterium]|nr:OmpA family protein [Cryomorphaceae bacterium]